MRVYTPEELRRFLVGVDAALDRQAEVVVIGGAAAALEYGVVTGTRDIDTWRRVRKDLAVAWNGLARRRVSMCHSLTVASRMDRTTSNRVLSGPCRIFGA